MKGKNLLIVVIFLAATGTYSCQRKYVCPAYQSSFILDENKTEKLFSLFGADTLPKKNYFVDKNKTGIIAQMNSKEKHRSFHSIKMETVYPPPLDSTLLAGNDLYALNDTDIDSLFTAPPSSHRYKYNRDQEVYMKHIAPSFKWLEHTSSEGQSKAPSEEKRKKRGWFWNKKKTDAEPDEAQQDEEIEGLEEF